MLFTFHGKAKAGAQGAATFKLSNIIVSDAGDATGATVALGGVKAQDGVLAVGGSAPVATQPVTEANAPGSQTGPTPTLEPTIVKRTSLDQANANSSSGSIPWVIILPVVGVVVVGGGILVVLRKK